MTKEQIDCYIEDTRPQGMLLHIDPDIVVMDDRMEFEGVLEFARSLGSRGEELARRLIAERGNGQPA